MPLPTRKIGSESVTAIGYGTMGLAAYYTTAHLTQEERLKVLDAVYENGCTMWDTADCYGDAEVTLGYWYVVVFDLIVFVRQFSE